VAAATAVLLVYSIGQGSFSDGMPLGISGTFNFHPLLMWLLLGLMLYSGYFGLKASQVRKVGAAERKQMIQLRYCRYLHQQRQVVCGAPPDRRWWCGGAGARHSRPRTCPAERPSLASPSSTSC
jgi:hypothetical protein